jgi:hypothetical protein
MKKVKLFDVKMHGVFAYFTVSKEIYEAAIKSWPRKTKITHQILPTKTIWFSGRRVYIRIFPEGKVSFIIRASAKPVDIAMIYEIYSKICVDLKKIVPDFEFRTTKPEISRADVHIDSFSLPRLYPIIPIIGTVISIHKVKSTSGKLIVDVFRVEIRGPYEDALNTLVRLLGIRRFTF